ncbi:substrate-binding domain-containing protein [Ponticoccus sp. SC2-23]|nr:substrate-binding domain-containing protein [Ponticoccus sp. SC6-9]MBM1223963.1 substrate-binding domain-containing protein [Ponticoccus sp. SC6-15]MBM1230258.1 substrate-binding domain-containing protein [Ponticoccus sp. SC6-38]MBM1232929.1 substrate-binding domain-containing protein [Ponticoccus sp. SC6-45]MBM1237121.1 substrate-binding domain-containing protein [Ponticoccus sp. SC6-49]MBM1241940.1 substrate-binding domain-containing protein [Ponticoccus sp. SC2-64]MBM1246453.1 substrate
MSATERTSKAATPRSRRGRVTISDVSDALGLTKSTVSRALNDYADISEATRLKVRRKADAMGYRPLSQAQAIRTGLSRSLGLVIQQSDHDAHRPFLAEFLAGVSDAASAEGYTLTVASSASEETTLETFRAMLADHKADGFILPRARLDDARIRLLLDEDVPFVLFGRTRDPHGCAWFDIEGEAAIASAVERLVALGHRRIAYLGGFETYTYAWLRERGFRAAMQAAGLSVNEDQVIGNCVTREGGSDAAARILALPDRPTAIVCAVDMAALGVYRAAEKLGLVIGRDLSVIGYDGIPEGDHTDPPLNTFAVDNHYSGARLAALLIRRIRGEDPEALRELASARFLDRGSMGPPTSTDRETAQQRAPQSLTS